MMAVGMGSASFRGGTLLTVNKSGPFYMMECMAVRVPEPTCKVKESAYRDTVTTVTTPFTI